MEIYVDHWAGFGLQRCLLISVMPLLLFQMVRSKSIFQKKVRKKVKAV